MIETERLLLRRWREADIAPFIAMSADPDVMHWLGGVLAAEHATARIERFEANFDQLGYGRWAIERLRDRALIGYAGMMPIGGGRFPLNGVEIGWALIRGAWGQGYASEAARAAITDGFARIGLAEILTYTAEINSRSQAVMRRIGMVRDPARDFDHPSIAEDDPLRAHLVHVAHRPG